MGAPDKSRADSWKRRFQMPDQTPQVLILEDLPGYARQLVNTIVAVIATAPGSPEARLEVLQAVERELERYDLLVRG
jgi:hypothetical protein